MRRLGPYLNAGFGWPLYGICTALAGLGIGITALNPLDPMKRGGALALRFFWGNLFAVCSPQLVTTYIGLENLGSGPYVLAVNHQSSLDIPFLFGLPIPLKLVARPGLFFVKVMGPFLRLSGQIRSDQVFPHAVDALAAGMNVVVFVEGTRSQDGSLLRFRKGAFRVAAQAGVPVLPVTIDGSWAALPRKQMLPKALICPTWIVVDPPIHGDDPDVLMEQTRVVIEKRLVAIRKRHLVIEMGSDD